MVEDETLEISPAQESVESRVAPPESQGPGMTMEELTQHVLKVMENSGWNKPGHMAHQGKARQSNSHPGSPSPRYDNPDQDMRCDNCNGIGHRAENGWADLICKTWTSYSAMQDPTVQEVWQVPRWSLLGDARVDCRLARQGIVKGLPTPMLDRLLAVKADPDDESLNH
ncbi:LOW QUALITY PROTEIN: hypothetical protein PHMEG_00039163 [Phytophthora megakarya]|uniref:Uncharacterized protein n=1 Tax=Phytophthora megakarya TaxID=4795 RepID=A0A225UFZ7_9STRA|nr:LOW QUALITY PROTEIN: hypothetical protein PHMEG_00039163 [Phytophthora megakarya]